MLKLKRKFGDRYDGYSVKNIDPLSMLVPHIMKERVDAQVFFEEEIEITELEKFIRKHGETDIPGLKMYHLLVAACIRVFSQKPQLNRFCINGKLYARNKMEVCMTIMRGKGEDATTTVVKPEFELTDTLQDVVRKFNAVVEADSQVDTENDTDNTAKLFSHVPGWMARLGVNFLGFLDRHGMMPKAANRVSPFHTSLFITNLGSLGIKPVYHHIYNFGTTSIFLAMGKKRTVREIDLDGNVVKKRKIDLRVAADERICEGHYYAGAMRIMGKILLHPECLLTPPEEVKIDEGINMKGRL